MNRLILFFLAVFCVVTLTYSEDDSKNDESKSKYFRKTTKRYPNYLGFVGGF